MTHYDLFEPGELPQSFGQALRYLRNRAGLTQTDLAEMAGMKQTSISRIETGEIARPTYDTLSRIAAVLAKQGVRVTAHDLDVLAGELGEVDSSDDAAWDSLERRAQALPDELRGQLYIAMSALLTALEIASR